MSEAPYRVGYVVLHYNTDQDTVECINSIRRMTDNPIVIVCNGSKNDSDEFIEKYYENQMSIFVIKNNENKGFARGNNDGIRYLRQNNIADIVVCINNDIVFTDASFEEKIVREYISSGYSVGGGGCSKPLRNSL